MSLCGWGGSGRVVTLAEETGEGLFLNPLAFVLKFATNYRKSPPQASIWLLMWTCHTHFQSCYSFSLDCSQRPFLLLKIVIFVRKHFRFKGRLSLCLDTVHSSKPGTVLSKSHWGWLSMQRVSSLVLAQAQLNPRCLYSQSLHQLHVSNMCANIDVQTLKHHFSGQR